MFKFKRLLFYTNKIIDGISKHLFISTNIHYDSSLINDKKKIKNDFKKTAHDFNIALHKFEMEKDLTYGR